MTALQELIQYIDNFDAGGWEGVFSKKANELLETEKNQIIKSYHDGQMVIVEQLGEALNLSVNDALYTDIEDAEEYYNETYKNK